MTARLYWHAKAGSWVAYRDEPANRYDPETKRYVMVPDETKRVYVYDYRSGTTMLGNPAQCVRFDTKAEALAAARERWPRRVRGCRIGAQNLAA